MLVVLGTINKVIHTHTHTHTHTVIMVDMRVASCFSSCVTEKLAQIWL